MDRQGFTCTLQSHPYPCGFESGWSGERGGKKSLEKGDLSHLPAFLEKHSMIILKTFINICIKLYLFIKLFFFSCSSDDHNASSEEKGMNSKSTLSN